MIGENTMNKNIMISLLMLTLNTSAYDESGYGGGMDDYGAYDQQESDPNGYGNQEDPSMMNAGYSDMSQEASTPQMMQPQPSSQQAPNPQEEQTRDYFNELEGNLLAGDLDRLRVTCQMDQGRACGMAKNFLSACVLFLREEESFGGTGCVQNGVQKYRLDPEDFVYPANPAKNKGKETAVDHLTAQMEQKRKKLTDDKERFLKVICTQESLSMLDNKKDKNEMRKACDAFLYKGDIPDNIEKLQAKNNSTPKKSKKHRKRLKTTIIEDKESPDDTPSKAQYQQEGPMQSNMGYPDQQQMQMQQQSQAFPTNGNAYGDQSDNVNPYAQQANGGMGQQADGMNQQNGLDSDYTQLDQKPSSKGFSQVEFGRDSYQDNSSPGFGPPEKQESAFGKLLETGKSAIGQYDTEGKISGIMNQMGNLGGNLQENNPLTSRVNMLAENNYGGSPYGMSFDQADGSNGYDDYGG